MMPAPTVSPLNGTVNEPERGSLDPPMSVVQAVQALKNQYNRMKDISESFLDLREKAGVALQDIDKIQAHHQAKIQELRDRYEHENQRQLQTYDQSRDKLMEKTKALQQSKSELETRLQQELESNKKLSEQTNTLRSVNEQRKKEVESSNALAAKSEEKSRKLEKENKKIVAELESTKKELGQIKSLFSCFHNESPTSFSGDIKKIAGSMIRTVYETFQTDVSDVVYMPGTWYWKEFVRMFEDYADIPLSPQNSKDAKAMRAAAALAYLANLLNNKVFVSTYLVEHDSELREVLFEEAEDNPERELLCRAVLLHLQRSKESDLRHKYIAEVVEKIAKPVELLHFNPDVVHKFRGGIEALVKELMTIWSKLSRCKIRVQADIDLQLLEDWRWDTIAQKGGSGRSSPVQTAGPAEVAAVVFPRVYTVCEEEYKPIFSGVVLKKSQTEQARKEMEEEDRAGSPLATQSQLSQQRQGKPRRVSNSTSEQIESKQRAGGRPSFLGEHSQKDGANEEDNK